MAKVASKSGVPASKYRRIERGQQDPSLKEVEAVLSAYDWELAGVKPKEI